MTSVGIMASAVHISAALRAWPGPDPTYATNAGDFEIGVAFKVNAVGVQLVGVAIWQDATNKDMRAGRNGKLYDSGGGSLATTATITAPAPTGWSEWLFTTPYTVSSTATVFTVSADFGPPTHYGQITGGLSVAKNSTDGLITFQATGGRTNAAPDAFATSTSTAYNGVDILYRP